MDAAEANGNADGAEAPQQQAQPFSVKFQDMSGFELVFKLKRITKLGKAMDAFSARAERPRESLRFLFDGQRVLPGDTADSVGLEDDDTIEVHSEQIGGGGHTE